MHPSKYAAERPSHPAIIMASTGEVVTYGEMESRANQTARFFRNANLRPGDVIAICMDNKSPKHLEIAWGAQRCGLYFTCISTKLKTEEICYILEDSEAKFLFASSSLAESISALPDILPNVNYYSVGEDIHGFQDYATVIAHLDDALMEDGLAGADMLYSSGTTGKPKGIKPPLSGGPFNEPTSNAEITNRVFGIDQNSIYLSPAPLYHAAPLRWCMAVHRLGGTTVVMERWDELDCLSTIEKYRVDSAQFVPTHFVRLLKLPQEDRNRFDVSSLTMVVHAAAPCPVEIKEQMFSWFGPIIHEYYSGTEGPGMCYISPEEWLSHKGSVGKSIVGEIRICNDDGDPLPQGQEGTVYFEGGPQIDYHNAPEKSREATNKRGWGTMGDIGRVDAEGYLYLTDRKSFTIISGGVNIYPQEIENTLVNHPDVMDVAVIGIPDSDLGEAVLAVIQPIDMTMASDELAEELIQFTRDRLSNLKSPRRVEFRKELPRHPNGKLYKKQLRDEYWKSIK